MHALVSELNGLLRDFAADPQTNGAKWRRIAEPPSDLLWNVLEAIVQEAARGVDPDPSLFASAAVIRGPRFGEAVATYYRDRGEVQVDAGRIARNALGLMTTAITAATAIRLARPEAGAPKTDETLARTWAAQSAVAIPGIVWEPGTALSPLIAQNPIDPGWQAERVFRQIEVESGCPCTAALYWTLYWLNRQAIVESGRRVQVPVAAANSRTVAGLLAELALFRLADGQRGVLVEHPEMALLPLGRSLTAGLERAWRAGGVQSACWCCKAPHSPQDGDSLSAAAAVGFRQLSDPDSVPKHYLRTCLIVARLGENDQLLAAGFQKQKLEQAYAKGIRTAVLAAGGETLTSGDVAELEAVGLRIIFASTLAEAELEASGVGSSALQHVPDRLLDQYSALKRLPAAGRVISWLAKDDDNATWLVKTWPLDLGRDGHVGRALWDRELRNMYRLASSPAAERSLMVMKDAGVDLRAGCFVMVMGAPGYRTLSEALAQRNEYPWLTQDGQTDQANRRGLWSAFHIIGEGVRALHKHHIVHRNIAPENLFLSSEQGFETWRLGGFEWSVRFGGQMPDGRPRGDWHVPPEVADRAEIAVSFEDDWYAFGMLAARCFFRVENIGNQPASEINQLVFDRIGNDTGPLSVIERGLLLDLIRPRREDRLKFGYEVIRRLDGILQALAESGPTEHAARESLVLVFSHRNEQLIEAAVEAGFRPDEKGESKQYNPYDLGHIKRLKEFLLDNFSRRAIYALPDKKTFLLVGKGLNLQVSAFRDETSDLPASWDVAFVRGPRQLRSGKESTDITSVPLRIETLQELRPQRRWSWERYLPASQERGPRLEELSRFWEVLRCTNQLELIMHCTEVFPYRMLPAKSGDGSDFFETVRLEPVAADEDLRVFMRNEGGMLEFFQRELESNKRGSDRVLLTQDRLLRYQPKSDTEFWEIREIVTGPRGYLELRRRKSEHLEFPQVQGYVRSFGFHGQIRLIQRRKEAIDRLEEHTYLLKALCKPQNVFIDTRQVDLPYELPAGTVDESKLAVMQDVLRTRPIYALQGPPGTGKTTLVAHLIRQILEEDPVAQILVTAQAHGAVDVLREKVEKEAFRGVPRENKPIMVRLGLGEVPGEEQNGNLLEGTVEKKAADLLDEISATLRAESSLAPIQTEWAALIEELRTSARSRQPLEHFTEFQELVRRGANIVFCTTSAGDLEDLAKGEQFFDWTVVEEAGKVHGYDLALPLQAGHRWLLLGDHQQLPPYRIEDFVIGVKRLDVANRILDSLSGPDRLLVDGEWVGSWRERTDKPEFQEYASDWVRAFGEIFNRAGAVRGLTILKPAGAAAGRLSAQYRMHPTIGRLISETFYEGKVIDKTDEVELQHSFEEPYIIQGKALVWLDLPWADQAKSRFHERGWPRYTNEMEVEEIKRFLERLRFKEPRPPDPQWLAVLSPYNRQRRELHNALENVRLPEGLQFRESLTMRRGQRGDRRAHTVDSFQGNQADVVIISLVRNNEYPPKASATVDGGPRGTDPLGFLDDEQRLNVLLSRAERLLVLVGSWSFFERQLQGVSIQMDTSTYLWYWKKLLTMFQEFERQKKAVRIPYRGTAARGSL